MKQLYSQHIAMIHFQWITLFCIYSHCLLHTVSHSSVSFILMLFVSWFLRTNSLQVIRGVQGYVPVMCVWGWVRGCWNFCLHVTVSQGNNSTGKTKTVSTASSKWSACKEEHMLYLTGLHSLKFIQINRFQQPQKYIYFQ